MVRGKVKVNRLETAIRRQVTFYKRQNRLFEKAAELSLLCDAQIAIIMFSPSGKLYEFGSPNMSRPLARYQKDVASARFITQESHNIEELRLEVESFGNIITSLENTKKHMIGEDLNALTFKELQCLEKKVEVGVRKICSRKEALLIEHLASLKKEGRSLQEENAKLRNQKKISGLGHSANEENVTEGPTTIMNRVEETDCQQDDLHETNLTLSLS